MARLVEFIFENLDTNNLSREEVLEHLDYLREIIPLNLPVSQKIRYLSYYVKMNRRLVQLDRQDYNSTREKLQHLPISGQKD